MRKSPKTKGMQLLSLAALLTAAALPITASAAEEKNVITGTNVTSAIQTQAGLEPFDHFHKHGKGRGGFGAGYSDTLLKALKLDAAALKAKLEAGQSLAAIAEAQGVSRTQLKELMTKDFNDRLEKKKAAFADHLDQMIDAKGNVFAGEKRLMFKMDLTAVRNLLGMDEAAMHEALHSGKTLAELAKAKGVDPQKLIDAQVAEMKSAINQRVKDGSLTQAQADQHLAKAAQMATDFVNGTGPKGKPMRMKMKDL
ncbi:hypothetical protein [Paenibacillus swuensis]|uniref:hypothetical protein n=1 Tax=Paenibacillus swuensis TaxID=1178515 RepID=UPI00083859F4|nr:hypothetical protein [Paenibacillus swuensis]